MASQQGDRFDPIGILLQAINSVVGVIAPGAAAQALVALGERMINDERVESVLGAIRTLAELPPIRDVEDDVKVALAAVRSLQEKLDDLSTEVMDSLGPWPADHIDDCPPSFRAQVEREHQLRLCWSALISSGIVLMTAHLAFEGWLSLDEARRFGFTPVVSQEQLEVDSLGVVESWLSLAREAKQLGVRHPDLDALSSIETNMADPE